MGFEHVCKRTVFVARPLFGKIDAFVKCDIGIVRKAARQVEKPFKTLVVVISAYHRTEGDRTHVDHWIQMLAQKGLRRNIYCIEGLARCFNTDA